jgi:uncharacterized integral membrane protein
MPASESGGFMWIVKSAVGVIIFILLLGFSIQNLSQTTTIYVADKAYNSVPIIIVMFVAFAIGVMFWFIVSIFQHFKYTNQIAEFKRKNRQLLEEIKALRNLPLEEIAPQDIASDATTDD